MARTRIQKLWHRIDKLKVLLNSNPHVPIGECKALVKEMEELIIKIRYAEIRARKY